MSGSGWQGVFSGGLSVLELISSTAGSSSDGLKGTVQSLPDSSIDSTQIGSRIVEQRGFVLTFGLYFSDSEQIQRQFLKYDCGQLHVDGCSINYDVLLVRLYRVHFYKSIKPRFWCPLSLLVPNDTLLLTSGSTETNGTICGVRLYSDPDCSGCR